MTFLQEVTEKTEVAGKDEIEPQAWLRSLLFKQSDSASFRMFRGPSL
jgi:hypothetical protein